MAGENPYRKDFYSRAAPFAMACLFGFAAYLLVTEDTARPIRPAILLAAAALAALALAAVLLLPWERLPRGLQATPPLAFILIVLLLHAGAGLPEVVYQPLLLLPLVWLALYGTRADLVVGLILTPVALSAVYLVLRREPAGELLVELLTLAAFPIVCIIVQNLVRRTRAQAAQLADLARTDELTGIPNRRAWEETLPRELSRARRERRPLCVAMLDLDRFKRYNDRRGHLAGDGLLKATTAAWTSELRAMDLLARTGGEEFALLLPACGVDHAANVAERLRARVPDGQTCSVGIARWNGAEPAESIVARADSALYEAKRAGRDRVVVDPT